MSLKRVIKQIKRNIRHLPLVLFSFLTVLGFQNCGGAQFSDVRNLASLGNCSTELEITQKKLRILFMVDNSISTKNTDPNKYFRLQTVQTFLNTYQAKQNFTYAFGLFSLSSGTFFDSTTQSFIINSTHAFGNATHLSQALQKFSIMNAASSTPYAAALTALENVILEDINQTQEWEYVIVFMSDGQPTDIAAPVSTNLIAKTKALRESIQNQGRPVTLSTVYFGAATDTNSINNLMVMAQEGGGQFVNTNLSSDLVIDDLITILGQPCLN